MISVACESRIPATTLGLARRFLSRNISFQTNLSNWHLVRSPDRKRTHIPSHVADGPDSAFRGGPLCGRQFLNTGSQRHKALTRGKTSILTRLTISKTEPFHRMIVHRYAIGPLRRAFLTWISEFPIGRLSISVSHLRPKLALNPETSKKE
jgi:hypothetical protein